MPLFPSYRPSAQRNPSKSLLHSSATPVRYGWLLLLGLSVPLSWSVLLSVARGAVAVAQTTPVAHQLLLERSLPLRGDVNPDGQELARGEMKPQLSLKNSPPGRPAMLSRQKQADAGAVLLQTDGALTDEDERLSDNSRYDAYLFEGEAGQIIRISLESNEFDTYLLLEDPSGERIAANDDGGNGTNAELVVQLPQDGQYRIVANAYDSTGQGNYSLTVTTSDAVALQEAETRQEAERLFQQGLAESDLIDRAITNGKRLSELEAKDTLTDAELDELVALQAEQREILQAFNDFKDSPLVQEQLALLSPEERDRNVQLDQLAALRDNLSQIPQGAVMLYPLILDYEDDDPTNDTLELVITSPYATPIHRTVNVSRAEINAAVQAFRYALEEPTRDAITPAQTLYQWLIAPIEADLEAAGVNTIIYAPDRSLRYIPLAALHDGTQWLAERYRINNITAASLTDLNTPPRSQPRILAGALTEGPITVAVGERSFNFRLLEHADDEVNNISNLAPDITALFDTDFNRARIERDANRHTIIHLATHAQFLVGQPEDSFILFSNQERWTLADFDEGLLNLTRVDLVVLSACETGVDNTFGNGEEILGFGYLMQVAGARASMASLWAVDDGGTQILMTEFYDALIRGNLSKVEALQQAQLALIRMGEEGDRGGFEMAAEIGLDPNDLSHPHYWAPFILIGNGL